MEMGLLQYLGTYDEPNGVSELNAALQNDESYGLPLICDDVTDVTVNCNYCKLLCHDEQACKNRQEAEKYSFSYERMIDWFWRRLCYLLIFCLPVRTHPKNGKSASDGGENGWQEEIPGFCTADQRQYQVTRRC